MNKKNNIRRIDVMWGDRLEKIVTRAKSLSKRNNEKIGFTFNGINFIINHRTPYDKVENALLSSDLLNSMDSNLNYDISVGYKQTWDDIKLKNRLRLTFNQKNKSLLSIFNNAVERANNSDVGLYIEHNKIIISFDKGDDLVKKIIEYYSKVKECDLNAEERSERDQYLPYIMKKEADENAKKIKIIKSRNIKKIDFIKK